MTNQIIPKKLAEGYVPALFSLATKKPPPPHAFGAARRIPGSQTASGREQIERTCISCPLVKITVIGSEEPRQWRFADGAQFVERFGAAECVGVVMGEKAAT